MKGHGRPRGLMGTHGSRGCAYKESPHGGGWLAPPARTAKVVHKERVPCLPREKAHVRRVAPRLKELVPAGLPEITDESLAWLPRAVTSSELKSELKAALADWVRRLDNANHNRVHRESGSVLKPRERPASTLMEAHVEVEELRTLLSRANARADALQRDLDQLRGLDGSSRPSGSRVL